MTTGRQEPTFSVVGDYAYSYGEEVVEMFEEEGGATFYPSQKQELKLMLARKKNGSPAALTIGISKPRQNGKSYSARYYAAHMGDFEHKPVLYSAHHSSTTNKMFKALCNLYESPERYPEFAKDVKSISHVRGYEGIYFKDWQDKYGIYHDGGCIEFATRTNSGSRGGTYSVIIIDEAQELTDDQLNAMLPTMSAASEVSDAESLPQIIYIGTPPGPTCKGTTFKKMHDKAHSGEDAEAWWLEHSIESLNIEEDITPENAVDLAYQTNPAMGYRISEDTIRNEFETMSRDGFARERLGWWTPTITHEEEHPITEELWDACATSSPLPKGKTAYGVKFSADGSEVCLAGAIITENGKIRIEMIDRKSTNQGTRWLAEWLNKRYAKASCVVIDGRNGVDVLIDRLQDTWKAKDSIIRPKTNDVIAASGYIIDGLMEQNLNWFEPQTALRESAISSTKRPIRGGWGFGGENSTPIEACSLALFGAKTSKRNPGKEMRIG